MSTDFTSKITRLMLFAVANSSAPYQFVPAVVLSKIVSTSTMYTPELKSCSAIKSVDESSASTPVLLIRYEASSTKVNSLSVMLFIPTPRKPSLIPFRPSSSEKKSKLSCTSESARLIHCVSQSAESADVVLSTYRCVRSKLVVFTKPSELKKTFQLPLSPSVVLGSPIYSISSKSIGLVAFTIPLPSSSI